VSTITQESKRSGAVAAYATLDGAERAVTHLVSLGYDEHDVGIGPRDFEVVDQHPLRRLLRRGLRWGVIAGAATMTAIALGREIGGDALLASVLPLIAWGVLGGLVVGLVAGVVAYRQHRAHSFLAPPDVIVPTRFEVVVDRDHDQARHGLARWWDPAATPAGWQQPA
jgi:hypothetical protein